MEPSLGVVKEDSLEPPGSTVSLLIADETRMGCELLNHALSQSRFGFRVVASAITTSEILDSLASRPVDVALINHCLHEGSLIGFDLLKTLHQSYPQTRVVMLLKTAGCDFVVDAFRAGARGIFYRTQSFEALCKCIDSVHRGQVWANSGQLNCLLEALIKTSPSRVVDYSGRPLLTKREDELASAVAEGLSNKDIADKLRLSEHTVSNYLFRIYEKLGLSSRVELALYILRNHQQC
ncbi:MAG TPA: response regulator transcription factor [Terriglobales bacterium]|nr:response regulator transcription factor [Terriglobales bacterium]